MSTTAYVSYTPSTTGNPTIEFKDSSGDPWEPSSVAAGTSVTFTFERFSANGQFKFRGLVFWYSGESESGAARSFANVKNGETPLIGGAQVTGIHTQKAGSVSFTVNNDSAMRGTISVEVFIEDFTSQSSQTRGRRYASRDPQIKLEGPGT